MKSISTARILLIAFVVVCVPTFIYSQAANNTCATATTLTPGSSCSSTTGNLQKATSASADGATSGSCGGATAATTFDVWFKFTASSTTQAITIQNLGANLNGSFTPYVELLSGTCGSFSVVSCTTVSTDPITVVATTLTPTTTYYIRVYTTTQGTANPATKWDFSICVQGPPANDDCAGAVALTPALSCTTTATTLNLATATTGLPAGCESVGTHYDVWYKFVAAQSTQTISISSLGTNFTNPEIQIYSSTAGACPPVTSLFCGTTNVTATGLTTGNTYFVRVSNVGSAVNTNGAFNICVVNTLVSDDCAGAVTLVSNSTCNTTTSTLIGATASAGVPAGCASAGTHYDVWFKFVAVTAIETITFAKVSPSNISSPELQLFSGTCGSLTSLQCGTTSISATGLTVGNTYYVRVSQVGGSALTTRGDFTICVRHSVATPSNIDFSKSYVNITKGNGGGTVNPGDTLEIRATLVLRSGTASSVDSLSMLDTLAAGEGMRLVPGSLALRTNEGKLYKSFTDVYDADAGWRDASLNNVADTAIQINFGAGASNVARGALTNTSKPSVFGSTCIIMATYRVVVTAAYNTVINLGGGEFTLRDKNSGSYSDLMFSPRNVMVYQSPGLCPNAVSATNAIGGDFNGTFGTPSGPPLAKNRGTSPNVPSYIYANFTTGAPQDYYYGITNNTGAGGASFTTTTTWPKPDPTSPTHRVFNVWDISGDHTGATNTAKGNPPCDTTKAVSATNPCGYMLVINSAYKTDTAFTYGVTNLCPNTYYEISAWIKNVCYKCSCDSNGVGASSGTPGYIPFAPNDSSGVQPNLAFDIDGTDYYTTGNIAYAGIFPTTQAGSDSTNIWVKRGFTYLTGVTQTSLTMTIRNNAPGGGGNDWALDDIALATCLPNMQYSPSLNPTTCQNNPSLVINDTVRSYFNNYANYKWQKSTDGGTTWTDVTSAGSTTPTWNGSAYEYITSYSIPQGSTSTADSGTKYRVVVATTSSNLSNSSCTVTDGISIITLIVNNCGPILDVNLLSFNGKMMNHNANLSWRTSKEYEAISFTIEKSIDGIHFSPIATLNGHGNNSQNNYYTYTDPAVLFSTAFYRIGMMNTSGKIKYSQVISLADGSIVFGLVNAVNPFTNEINFEIAAPQDAKVEAVLTNISGKPLKRQTFVVYEGVNGLTIPGLETLPVGMYILQVNYQGEVVNRKLMKR
jgi:hypothetical protein